MNATWASYLASLRKYIIFDGRASRAEFWSFVVVYMLICIGALVVDRVLGTANGYSGFFLDVAQIAQFLPLIAVSVRRLHDIDRTGWWQLLMLSGIGMILLIFFYAQRGEPFGNRFGPPPQPPAVV